MSEYRPEFVPAGEEAQVKGGNETGIDGTKYVRFGVAEHSLRDFTRPEFPSVEQRSLLMFSRLGYMEVILEHTI